MELDQVDVESIIELAYETQHFGFHPRSFTDGVYEIILDYLHAGMKGMQEYLAKQYAHIMPKKVIQTRTESLLVEMVAKLNRAMDKLEIYLNRNVFAIPKHVVLPEDKIHFTRPTTKEEMAELDSDISELVTRIRQAKTRNTLLKAKQAEQQTVISKLQSLQNMMDSPVTMASENGISDISESVKFFLSKSTELTEALQAARQNTNNLNSSSQSR